MAKPGNCGFASPVRFFKMRWNIFGPRFLCCPSMPWTLRHQDHWSVSAFCWVQAYCSPWSGGRGECGICIHWHDSRGLPRVPDQLLPLLHFAETLENQSTGAHTPQHGIQIRTIGDTCQSFTGQGSEEWPTRSSSPNSHEKNPRKGGGLKAKMLKKGFVSKTALCLPPSVAFDALLNLLCPK